MSLVCAAELSLLPIQPAANAFDDRPRSASRAAARPVFGPVSWLAKRPGRERAAHDGPGWFDSSWDLRSGLEVREGLPADASPREWIEGWLLSADGNSSLGEG